MVGAFTSLLYPVPASPKRKAAKIRGLRFKITKLQKKQTGYQVRFHVAGEIVVDAVLVKATPLPP